MTLGGATQHQQIHPFKLKGIGFIDRDELPYPFFSQRVSDRLSDLLCIPKLRIIGDQRLHLSPPSCSLWNQATVSRMPAS